MNHAPSTFQSLCVLLVCIAVCFGVAAAGAAGSFSAPTFYGQLQRPDWSPPAWLFGPVWTILYTLMAVAMRRVWRRQGWSASTTEVTCFLAQLVLNGLWSWLFFAWQQGAWAMLDIVVLWALIAVCARLFWRVDRWAGLLMIPYLVWVSFASALNLDLWLRNPGLL